MSKSNTGLALVTGASSGLGSEIARLLAEQGYDLALVGRDSTALSKVAEDIGAAHPVTIITVAKDLALPGAIDELVQEIAGRGREVDILVNNAGLGVAGPLAATDVDATTQMIAVNVGALTRLTQRMLPGMIARRRGRILHVGSVVGYQPGGPGMAAYFATKNYVLALSRALARELSGTGVTVTTVSPGPIATAFIGRSGMGETRVGRLVKPMDPKIVAEAAVRGMLAGRRTVLPGLLAKILAFAGELPPRAIALEVNRFLFSK
ncbi:MAG: SDR family oxidoreductase [Gammaproteobacteria bacterium]|nr:SDR family oxidoreductase [Gammaproteobacteria bacterium]